MLLGERRAHRQAADSEVSEQKCLLNLSICMAYTGIASALNGRTDIQSDSQYLHDMGRWPGKKEEKMDEED